MEAGSLAGRNSQHDQSGICKTVPLVIRGETPAHDQSSTRATKFPTKYIEMISTMCHGVRLAFLIPKHFFFILFWALRNYACIFLPHQIHKIPPLMVRNWKNCRNVDFDSSKEGSWCTCHLSPVTCHLSPGTCYLSLVHRYLTSDSD